MKRKNTIWDLLFIGILLIPLASCHEEQTEYNLYVRICAESHNGSDISFKVFPENSQGNIINGAVAYVQNADNIITYLTFNNNNQCYDGTAPACSSGEYKVIVHSKAVGEYCEISIINKVINERIVFSAFYDSKGNSVLAGDSIQCNEEVQIAWNSAGDDIVYQVQVTTAAKNIWQASTAAPNIVIPQGVLTDSTIYYFQISAQSITGDPTFLNTNYYSVSSIQSPVMSFYAE